MPNSLKRQNKSGRILVVRAGALGDTLMITPLLRRLYEQDARCRIDVLCSRGGGALLKNNPHVSQVFSLQHRNIPYLVSLEKRKLVGQLRENDYAFAVLLEVAPRYRELLEHAGIRDIRSFKESPFVPDQHSAVNNLRVAGIVTKPETPIDLEITVSKEAQQWANEFLAGLPRPRIGIHTGYGPAKKKKGQTERLRGWSEQNFIQVVSELATSGGSLIFTGAAEDRGVCEAIAAELPAAQVRIAAGETDLDQLPAVIEALDLMISVDSGPAHVAAAVGTPLVVLWGPGIIEQTGPVSTTTPIEILNARVPCAPCYGTPLMKSCTNNICMQQIRPEQVLAAARRLLAKAAAQ